MKIAQKFILLVLFLLSTTLANAQSVRHTSFDDRQVCDENGGTWREFGHGCGDSCSSKFDKYEICTSALTYACDCGKGRCWYEGKCLAITAYKKIFDKESAENEKILAAKAKERQERIKNDPTLSNYLNNLYVQKEAATKNQGAAAPAPAPNAITQAAPQRDIATQPAESAITQVQGVKASATPPAAGAAQAGGNKEIRIPPAFLQQEKAAQDQANKSAAAGNVSPPPLATTGGNTPPPLPVIPLPQ